MHLIKQFSKYCTVAVGSATVDWLIFTILIFIGTHYLWAQVVGRLCGGLFSFISNKLWSFEQLSKVTLSAEAIRFLMLYAVSFTLAIVCLWLLAEQIGLNPFVGKLLTDLLIFVFNFMAMRYFVFRSFGAKVVKPPDTKSTLPQ